MNLQPHQELSLHLWDLRSQLEGQVRCLTKIHPSIDAWGAMDASRRFETRVQVLKDLEDLIRISTLVGNVATEALAVAADLPLDHTQHG